MSASKYVLLPESRHEVLFALAQSCGWTVNDRTEKTFEKFASITWKTADGAIVSLVEIHVCGFRVLITDRQTLLEQIKTIVPLLDRSGLLAQIKNSSLEKRAFALRALTYLECDSPSTELITALENAAWENNRFFRQMVIFLCGFRKIRSSMIDTIAQCAASDAELAEEWAELLTN